MKTQPHDSISGTTRYDYKGGSYINDPLTKREHFASLAMQGLLSDRDNIHWHGNGVAEEAVKMADALISALNHTNPETSPINLNHDQ